MPAMSAAEVHVMPSALEVRHGSPLPMPQPHRHDDIEVNLVLEGELDYLFGGSRLTIRAGQAAVFWAATPHWLFRQSELQSAANPTRACWLHVPFSTVLTWRLPEPQIGRLLQLAPLIAPVESLVHDLDRLFTAWEDELRDPATSAPALLEAEALLRRVCRAADSAPATSGVDNRTQLQSTVTHRVTVMAKFITDNFRRRITLADIAASAHLNRTYASTIFRQTIGTTPGGYLAQRRVAEAQRLLITTDKSMIDIAYECGFNSQSSFYQQFTHHCRISPGRYRHGHGQLRMMGPDLGGPGSS